jgi:hypothetical protein
VTHEERMKADFRVFLIYIWRFLGLPDPTPVQLEIAYYLQHGGRRIVVQAFRGVGKSWITSAYVCWLLYRDPTETILVVSASKERSDAFSIFTKRLIWEVPILQHLRPDPNGLERTSNVAFDVRGAFAHAPSVKSVGITGQMTGSRARRIVADDVEVVNNSETAAQREKLLALVAEMGGAILTPGARDGTEGGIVFLGTPQVEDSLYKKLPAKGYSVRIWPAMVPETSTGYDGNLGPLVLKLMDAGSPAGTPVDPLRFDTAELDERRLEYGRVGFALQFLLDTSLSDEDRHPLKLRDFIVARTDVEIAPDKLVWGTGVEQEMPHVPLLGLPGDRFYRPVFTAEGWSPYEGKILYIDPSGRGKDLTGYAVVGMLHGYLVVRRWGGLVGGYGPETLAKLATMARDEKVNALVIESNFGDGMYAQLMLPVLSKIYPDGAGIEDDHVTGQKEARIIDNLEPALAAHKVILDETCLTHLVTDKTHQKDHEAVLKSPCYQLTRLTRDRGSLKYDDCLDALAGAVRWWTDRMARDVDQSVADRDEERFDEMLQRFAEGLSIKPSAKEFTSRTKVWSPVLTP